MRLLQPEAWAGVAASVASAVSEESDLSIETKWMFCVIAVVLVCVAGLMSGLTLGLLSIDKVDLEVLNRSGTAQEKRYAAGIAPLLRDQHFLLCTLVVWNAGAMEALPIFLDRLVDPVSAVILSVTVVLIFGEIVPQSVCTRYGLAVGYYARHLMRIAMALTSPIAWPLGKLLDALLGHGAAIFRRNQLKAFAHVHGADAGFGGELTQEEVQFIHGTLDMHKKIAAHAMTPLEKVHMLSTDALLDEACMQRIMDTGVSRMPVYQADNKSDIVGLIMVKELLLKLANPPIKVNDLKLRNLPRLSADMSMSEVLQLFKTGRTHMAVLSRATEKQRLEAIARVRASQAVLENEDAFEEWAGSSVAGASPGAGSPSASSIMDPLLGEDANKGVLAHSYIDMAEGNPLGIITIEDVIEELLGTEIIDETDRFVDNMQTAKVNAALLTKSLPANLRAVLAANHWKGPHRPAATHGSAHGGAGPSHTPGSSPAREPPQIGLTPSNVVSASRAAAAVSSGHIIGRNKDVRDAAAVIEEHLNKEPSVQSALGVLREAVNLGKAQGAHSSTLFGSHARPRSSSATELG